MGNSSVFYKTKLAFLTLRVPTRHAFTIARSFYSLLHMLVYKIPLLARALGLKRARDDRVSCIQYIC